MEIPVIRNVLEANEKLSARLKEHFARHGILTLNLISSPGAGKTSLLERTLADLSPEFRMAVIEGDLQTDNDAQRVAATGAQAVQINTEGGCHLDSNLVMEALGALDLSEIDILFIENVGNLVCPVEFDCGEDAKIALLSLPEGDDKPEKYPFLFNRASAMILNTCSPIWILTWKPPRDMPAILMPLSPSLKYPAVRVTDLKNGMIGSVRLSAPNAAHQTNKTHVLRLNISCLKRYAGTQYPCIPFHFRKVGARTCSLR